MLLKLWLGVGDGMKPQQPCLLLHDGILERGFERMMREVIADIANQIELLVIDLVDKSKRCGNKGSLREGGDGPCRAKELLNILSTDVREAVML